VNDTGEERPRRGEERRKIYLRRLAAAAAASVVLHLVLARGLAVSSLGTPAAKDETTAGKEPLKPKRPPSDFPLEVSPSVRERPAHEKPLAVAARPPKREKPARKPEPERRAATERRNDRAAEEPERVRPTEAPLERTRQADTARVAPDRAAAARASETAESRADSPASAPAEAAAPARAPVPATLQPRDANAGAVASRWRPREVELLERLASRPAVASRVARDAEADTAEAPALERRSDRGAASPSDARADTLAGAAPAAASPAASPAPAAVAADGRRGGRAAGRSAAASSAASAAADSATSVTTAPGTGVASTRPARSAATAGGAAASRPRVVTSGPATGVASAGVAAPATSGASGSSTPAPSAAALDTASRGGRAGGSRAASGGGGRAGSGDAGDDGDASGSGTAGAASGGWVGAASVARGGGRGGASGSGEATTPARAAASAAGGAGGTGTADTIATGPAGGPAGADAVATLPGPAALGRIGGTGRGMGAAGLAGGGAGGSALGAGRRGGGDGGAGDDGEEGLSVGIGDGGAIAGGGRPRGGDDAGLPARIAAAALPVEGRVRDVAEAFAGRTGGGAGEPRTAKVIDPERARRADAMVDRGLEFLARSQQPDGRWSLGKFAGATRADVPKLESDTAATGLALLSFLGAGHDHFGGRYRDTVRRGLEFLLAVQKPDGDLFLPADDLSNSCAWLYSHGIASMAVCEAVGMTGDPLVKPAAEKACRFIASSQHPQLGGWRYTPRSDADLSVSGWMLVAVRSGQLAGVKTDPATLPGVRRLVEAAAARDDVIRYAYNPRKQDQRRSRLSAACMTAVGGLMRLHTGDRADDPRLVAAGKFLATIEPSYGTSADKVRDSYLWYYASQVLVHTAGPDWDRWYARLVDTLAAHQETTGPKGGSWDPLAPLPDRWGEYGGRIYVTALHLLALEVPYRHLPTTSIGER
jgi:hypothetical protein